MLEGGKMKKKWLIKILVIGIIPVFICMSTNPSFAFDNMEKSSIPISDGSTLYVGGSGPDNYTTIQSAINNAQIGDTVFVYDDSSPYYEIVSVIRAINIIGENVNTTKIINNIDNYKPTLSLNYGALVKGFTIIGENASNFISGIYVHGNNNIVYDNNISSNTGIELHGTNNSILKNIIKSNEYCGIRGDGSNSTIENNTIYSKGYDNYGFNMEYSYHNFINNNLFVQTDGHPCIRFYSSRENVITNNTLQNGGIRFLTCPSYDFISNNTVDGKSLVFLCNESDRLIDYDAGQVILINCNNVTIKNQNFSNLNYALHFFTSNNCNIIDNIISNSYVCFSNSNNINFINNKINWDEINYIYSEIDFRGCNNINISRNTITNISAGISFTSCCNSTISYNNFIDNIYNIIFEYDCRNCSIFCNNFISHKSINKLTHIHIFDPFFSNNTLKHNYWWRPRLFPKFIHVTTYEGNPEYPPDVKFSFYIDWRPALKLYDIPIGG